MPQELSIAIIGAGPAGLVLALSLLRLQAVRPNYTVSIQIFDAASELRPTGAAFALSSNGVRPLRQLGILDDLLQGGKAEVLTAMKSWEAKTQTLLMDAKMPPLVFGQPFITVSRASLQEALLGRLVPFGVQPQLSQKLVSVSPCEDNKLALELANGSNVQGFDYVIGADGVRSRVRDAILGGNHEDNLPYFQGWYGILGLSEPLEGLEDADKGVTHACIPASGIGGYGTWDLPEHRQFWTFHTKDMSHPAAKGKPPPTYGEDDLEEAIKRADGLWTPHGDGSMLIARTPRDVGWRSSLSYSEFIRESHPKTAKSLSLGMLHIPCHLQ